MDSVFESLVLNHTMDDGLVGVEYPLQYSRLFRDKYAHHSYVCAHHSNTVRNAIMNVSANLQACLVHVCGVRLLRALRIVNFEIRLAQTITLLTL
jgi:hypothetical protein